MNRRAFLTTSTTALAGTLFVPTTSHALDLTQAPLPFSLEDSFFHGALVEVGTSGDLGAAR